MPGLTFSADPLCSQDARHPSEESEPNSAALPSCRPVALSAMARERLRVLNQVLENCVPPSKAEREAVPQMQMLE